MGIAADLLDQKPASRHDALNRETTENLGLILANARRSLGSPFGIWRDDPLGFFEDVLGEYVWSKPRAIIESVRANRRSRAVASHSVSKTFTAGRLLAWHLSVWPEGEAKAISTAPTFRQVRNVLWPHVHAVHERCRLPGTLNQVEWKTADGVVAGYGFSPNRYEESATQGIHSGHLLIVVDEAGGIPASLGQGLDSLMTGDARILAIGNPPTDVDESWFERIGHSPLWETVHISAFDSPNFTGEACPEEIARNLVDRRWVDEIAEQYGVDDPYYVARVEAQFPKTSSRRVIPVMWAEAVQVGAEPDPEAPTSGWHRLGVDVAAGGGDEMVVARLDGWRAYVAEVWSGAASADQVANAERVLEHIRRAEADQAAVGYRERPVRVKVDWLGVGGGTADVLKRMGKDGRHGAEIVSVNVGEAAANAGRYANKRAECWWAMREVIRERTIRLAVGEREIKQLTAPSFTDHTHGGRIVVESKASMQARGLPSPDRADALCLAVYEPGGSTRAASYGPQLATAKLPRRIGEARRRSL